VNPGGPARLLRELVAIESPSGHEGAAADFAFARLSAAGLEVERLGHSVLARLVRGRGPRVLFNSHLDTVPVGEGWSVPSIGNDWQDGRLFGRGSNDAKASVAAMIAAFEDLAARPAGLAGELVLALTHCEETTNAGMGAVVAHLGLESIHGGVTGEPTGLSVVRAQSGLVVLRAEWTGRSCHAAHVARVPHDNAMLRAATEITACAPYLTLEPEHVLLGKSTIAPTVLHAGTRHNVVPDRAEALFDARLAPPHDGEAARAAVAARLPSARVSIHSERLKPVETAAEHPFVREACMAAGAVEAVGSSTLSDMALLRGIPAVKCGPGQTARSHTPDEFVLLSELEAGHAFYRAFAPRALSCLAAVAAAR
jgi:acetylornithine deacetylase